MSVVGHQVRRTLGVVCVMLVIGGLGWAIYAGIIRPVTKPNPSTTQNAKQIINVYRQEHKFFGFKAGWIKIGIDIPQGEKLIKQEEE